MKWSAFLLLLCCCTVSLCSEAEKSKNWQKGQELAKQLKDGDLDARRDAAHELARLGKDATAALRELIKALEDRDKQVWIEATQALAHLGPGAEPAIEALLVHADSGDEQRRYRTAYALGSVGVAAVSKLEEKLNHGSDEVREVAVQALGWIGPPAADAIPAIVKRLGDKDELVRLRSVETLGKIGSASTDQLIEALQSDSKFLQIGASNALSLIGHEAATAANELVRLTRADDPKVQAAAIQSLGRIGFASESAIRALTQTLRSTDANVHQAALEALVRADAGVQPVAAKQLSDLLAQDIDRQLADRVALALGSYGSRATDAVPTLLNAVAQFPDLRSLAEAIGRVGQRSIKPTIEALRNQQISAQQVNQIVDGMPASVKAALAGKLDDPSPLVREVATLTLTKLVPQPKDTTQRLVTMLQDDSADVRRAAAESMAQLSGNLQDALPSVMETAKQEEDGDTLAAMLHLVAKLQPDQPKLANYLAKFVGIEPTAVRVAALSELAQLKRLPTSIHENLSEATQDENPDIRGLAIRAVVKTVGNKKNTARLVVAALEDPDADVREQALSSVAELGNAAAAALDVIAKQLGSESERVRNAAVESLAELGEVSRPAFDRVSALYEDTSSSVRMTVVSSLRKIEDEPSKLLPTLIQAIEDSEWEVRQRAAYELGEMEEDAAPAVPALLNMLRKDDESDAARQALREINTAGDDAVPVLMDIVRDKDAGRRPRYYALYLLRKMGSRAKSALPELKKLAEDSDGRYREYFDRAIKEISEDD